MNENDDSGEKIIISLKERAMARQRSGRETVEMLALEISNLRESCQTLPEALATEIMERIEPLEEIRERLDEITQIQRAAIKELTEEIAVTATQGMEQISDKLLNDTMQMEVKLKASSLHSKRLIQSANKGVAVTKSLGALKKAIDRQLRDLGSKHIQTALLTGLVSGATVIAYFTLL